MAGRAVKSALINALQSLAQDDLNRFIQELWDREEEPLIPRRKVEGKDEVTVANVMVSTLMENAVNVAVEIMKRIGCSNEAEKLVKKTGGQTSQSASTDVEEAGGQTSQSASTDVAETGGQTSQSDETHFVDKHRVALTERVSNIDSILDDLLDKKVIQQPTYTKIRVIATPQDKMRALYDGPLQAAEECKDVFYEILQRREIYLIKDLKRKK